MASGVLVSDSITEVYNDMKLQKLNLAYIILKIKDDKEIVIAERVERGAADSGFKDFKAKLPEKDCLYCIFDFEYTTKDGQANKKLVFVTWCPDIAKVKSKMLYASSKDALKRVVEKGIALEIQASELPELDEEAISDKLSKKI